MLWLLIIYHFVGALTRRSGYDQEIQYSVPLDSLYKIQAIELATGPTQDCSRASSSFIEK